MNNHLEKQIADFQVEHARLTSQLEGFKKHYNDLKRRIDYMMEGERLTLSSDLCGSSLVVSCTDGAWLMELMGDPDSHVVLDSESYPDTIRVAFDATVTVSVRNELNISFEDREQYIEYMEDPEGYLQDHFYFELENAVTEAVDANAYGLDDIHVDNAESL